MAVEHAAMKAEDEFFGALLRGDGTVLEAVLTPDFLLIDVMSGFEIPRDVLVALVGSRQLRFESVERIDSLGTAVRKHGGRHRPDTHARWLWRPAVRGTQPLHARLRAQ